MEERDVKLLAKLTALELLLVELLAHHYLRAPDPTAAAAEHRAHFKNLTAEFSIRALDPALSDMVTGEVADALDETLKEAEATALRAIARRKALR
jgi:hypothetical protein